MKKESKKLEVKRMTVKPFTEKYELKDQRKLFNQHLHDEVHSLPLSPAKHVDSRKGFIGYPDIHEIDLTAMQIFLVLL